MPTAATLPAIAKAIDTLSGRFDRLERRMDKLERGQEILAKNVHALATKVGKLENTVRATNKTLDRLIDYAADTKLAVERVVDGVTRLRERSEKTFDHFDRVVGEIERNTHELESLGAAHDRLDRKFATLASR